jgi:hypothetical protein
MMGAFAICAVAAFQFPTYMSLVYVCIINRAHTHTRTPCIEVTLTLPFHVGCVITTSGVFSFLYYVARW